MGKRAALKNEKEKHLKAIAPFLFVIPDLKVNKGQRTSNCHLTESDIFQGRKKTQVVSKYDEMLGNGEQGEIQL